MGGIESRGVLWQRTPDTGSRGLVTLQRNTSVAERELVNGILGGYSAACRTQRQKSHDITTAVALAGRTNRCVQFKNKEYNHGKKLTTHSHLNSSNGDGRMLSRQVRTCRGDFHLLHAYVDWLSVSVLLGQHYYLGRLRMRVRVLFKIHIYSYELQNQFHWNDWTNSPNEMERPVDKSERRGLLSSCD